MLQRVILIFIPHVVIHSIVQVCVVIMFILPIKVFDFGRELENLLGDYQFSDFFGPNVRFAILGHYFAHCGVERCQYYGLGGCVLEQGADISLGIQVMLGEYHLRVIEHEHSRAVQIAIFLLALCYLAIYPVYVLSKVFFMNDVFFFLSENVELLLAVLEPGMAEDFDGAETFAGVHLQQRVDEVDGVLGELGLGLRGLGRRLLFVLRLVIGVRVVHVVLPMDDKVVQLLHARGLEGHRTDQHRVKANPCTPYIHFETFVTFVLKDLWRDVGRGAALLGHTLRIRGDLAGDSKICYFDFAVSIQKDVV